MLEFFEVREGSLIYRENGETLMVTPWGKDSLRVRSVFAGEVEEGSVALLEPEPVEADIVIGEWEASITNGNIKARLWVNGWGHALQIGFYNQRGELLLREISNGGALQKKARHFRPLPGGEYELKVSFEASPEEKIYGMGQYQQEVMNLKGCNLELAHRNSQASIPFCLSDKGYGFLWHNAAVGEVHFGTNTTEWLARSAMQMDYWITAGDTPAQIEEAYARATGKSPMMPEYGLGFWQCKLRYYNQEQVLRIAREYKERGITPDVLIIDYYHWPRCGDWRFDPEYFPDPEAMVKELHEMGIETMVSVWPQVDVRSENFEEMKQKGLLLKSNMGVDVQMIFHGNNLFLDATNPRTRKYVWEKLKKNYADMGIQTFWLDEAEPEFGTYDFDLYTSSAGPMARTGNIYPREFARLVYEGQQEMGQRDVVNLIRCAWAGSQRYGALVWSGDIMSTYEDFRRQICAGLHMGICGIPWWTTDIGGFYGGDIETPYFRELIVRWFQYGLFCPVMRLHGSREGKDYTRSIIEPTGGDNELWSFGEENFEILKGLVLLRERMKPYLRSAMKKASEKGTPVMRPMFFDFPEDEVCYGLGEQYMFGDDILFAPVVRQGERVKKVYLPKGNWVLTKDRTVHRGGTWLETTVELREFVAFVREGSEVLSIF